MPFASRIPNAFARTLRPILSALALAAACAGLVLLAAPTGADQVAPIATGTEQYEVSGVFEARRELDMSLLWRADGRLRLEVGDEAWDLQQVGSGSSARFQMSAAGLEALEVALANDLNGRHAGELTDPAERARLEAMRTERRHLYLELSASERALVVAERRLADLRGAGGAIPFDALRRVQAGIDRLVDDVDRARRRALDIGLAIDRQRQSLSPRFFVTITALALEVEPNGSGTRARVFARIGFVAENPTTQESFPGTRTVKGKGGIVDLR